MGARAANSLDRLDQTELPPVRMEGVFDGLVEFREALLDRVAVLQQAVQTPDGVHVELGLQGERQPSQLGAQMVGQVG